MTTEEVQALGPGLYSVYWKGQEGKIDFAAVGITKNGDRWICCTSWDSPEGLPLHPPEVKIRMDTWRRIERVVPLAITKGDKNIRQRVKYVIDWKKRSIAFQGEAKTMAGEIWI